MNWLEAITAELSKAEVTQNKLARDLGVSTSMLSQVVRGIYPGSTETLQARVEGRLMDRTVQCPVKGCIRLDECLDHQGKPFSSANRERVKMHRACRSGCPNSKLEPTANSQRIDVRVSPNEEAYNIDSQLAYIKRSAQGDALKLNELLEKELSRLANRYNQLLWSSKFARRSKS
ncbi:helix-turn-helix domain-containing protein [Photobacterium minamisatsumaniensis]|uniref:helix-turn-helix domain-containing protein n=1 Tax=Photobacterium minamisatsumaniensis TaxID=2910233 RepID=UPI003D0F2F67